jgi:hypothetical protein
MCLNIKFQDNTVKIGVYNEKCMSNLSDAFKNAWQFYKYLKNVGIYLIWFFLSFSFLIFIIKNHFKDALYKFIQKSGNLYLD